MDSAQRRHLMLLDRWLRQERAEQEAKELAAQQEHLKQLQAAKDGQEDW